MGMDRNGYALVGVAGGDSRGWEVRTLECLSALVCHRLLIYKTGPTVVQAMPHWFIFFPNALVTWQRFLSPTYFTYPDHVTWPPFRDFYKDYSQHPQYSFLSPNNVEKTIDNRHLNCNEREEACKPKSANTPF